MHARNETEADVEDEGGPGLQDLLAVARRRWRLIGGSSVLLASAAAGIVLMLPNRYEASATVQIEQRAKKLLNIDNVISDLKADTATVESEVEVIRSKAIVNRVIEALQLRSDPEFTEPAGIRNWLEQLGLARKVSFASERRTDPQAGAARDEVADFLGRDRRGGAEPERDAVGHAFEGRMKAARLRNTLLIEVRFSSADPVKAARIANAITDAYITSQIEAKTRAVEQANALIDDKMRALRDKLAEAERRIERFKAANNIFDADGQLLSDRQVAREMEALVLARNHTAQAKARYEQARRMMLLGEGNDSIADVLQSHTVRQHRDELTKAMRREAELATKYGPKHPEMQRVQADIAKAQAELTAEVNKIIKNLKTEFEVAAERERQLATSLELAKGESSLSKEKQWELKELEREANANKQLFEALLARSKQTSEMLGTELPDARIVEPADVPLYPASPKRKQIVLLALLAGLGLGLAAAMTIEMLAPGIGSPEDVERGLDLAFLSSLPHLKRQGDGFASSCGSIRLTVSDPLGVVAEEIRRLKHKLDNGRRTGPARVVLVVSSLPGEGKTVVASNLAHHHAMCGSRVLLVDADLRLARLSHQLGMTGQPGLLDCLQRSFPAEQAIVRDATTGLRFLPAMSGADGRAPAAEILASAAFAATLARLRGQFETIVIDAPPVLPVVDARILAGLADQIVLVMTWRKTPKPLVRRALKLLGANAHRIAGVVVNHVDVRDHGTAWRDAEPRRDARHRKVA
jgi:capsular exopolysaccharide synthesis family protein